MDYRKIVKNKALRFKILSAFSWVPDKTWLKLLYRIKCGYWMDFNNPKTFNEKIQWLKIYGFRPEYSKMVDKYSVKDYVASKIGEEYIIPTLGVWDKPEDVEWEKLPNQFVLKTTIGGGGFGVWICKDKNTFDKELFVKQVYERYPDVGKKTQHRINPFREHPYDNVQDRMIAEKFISEDGGVYPPRNDKDLADYKFYCFNGEPRYCQVIRDRNTRESIVFYDMDWNKQEFVGLNPDAEFGQEPVARPPRLEIMKEICRKLSKDIPFVRVDLYSINEKEYFGELTFYPAGGFGHFAPDEWNYKIGDLIKLPGVCTGGGGK